MATDQTTPRVVKTDEQWRAELTPEEYAVLRKAGTERPYTGEYTDNHRTGAYTCRACRAALLRSDEQFDTRGRCPSFLPPMAGSAIVERVDNSLGMRRVEVLCANCHSHLGHVFEGEGYDTPTDLRHCMISISMRFGETEADASAATA